MGARRGIRVTGAAVVLRTRDKRESYHYRGAVVPADAFTEDAIAHAESLGLIEVVDIDDAPAADASSDSTSTSGDQGGSGSAGSDDDVQIPEGDPAKSWTHKQIDKWAGLQTPPIVFPEDAKSIDTKLAAIEAARKS